VRIARLLLPLLVGAALVGGGAHAATPPPGAPDVLVLVVSEGGATDRISFTYKGEVSAEQAKRDLAALARELAQPVPKAKISTESIQKAKSSPRMTSVETSFPGLVDRKNGRLHLEPHARAFRRLSRMRVTYFVFGAFRPGSPMATAPSSGIQLAVRAQPPVFTFDLWRADGAVASVSQGRPSLAWLAIPVVAALAAGIAAYFVVRARERARRPEYASRKREPAEPKPLLAGASGAASETSRARSSAHAGDDA
jgi:hypothetical protein